MTLQELLEQFARRPEKSVPDWMLGYYKRRSISFANGQTDLRTQVCWFQSRNFTIDLRLPVEVLAASTTALNTLSVEERQTLADYEGWEALCHWHEDVLSWHTVTSLQVNNRWPEPAILKRIGNCMIEFAPSGAYVEDWRLQPSRPGPLIGLRLIEEREVVSGRLRHQGGGLIICGDYAAMVLGRANPVDEAHASTNLRSLVAGAFDDSERLSQLFNFETSVATGSVREGFTVALSTQPSRLHQSLLALDGFEYDPDSGGLIQHFSIDGLACVRVFAIDTIEASVSFDPATEFSAEAEQWFKRESLTLNRYTEDIF